MGTEIVVDASALAKLFLDEGHTMAFRDWWYRELAGGATVLAPGLLRYELGSLILRNLSHLDAATRQRVWRETLAGVTIDDRAAAQTFDIDGLTFYDGAYVSLARDAKAILVTYDDKMTEVAQALGLRTERPAA